MVNQGMSTASQAPLNRHRTAIIEQCDKQWPSPAHTISHDCWPTTARARSHHHLANPRASHACTAVL